LFNPFDIVFIVMCKISLDYGNQTYILVCIKVSEYSNIKSIER